MLQLFHVIRLVCVLCTLAFLGGCAWNALKPDKPIKADELKVGQGILIGSISRDPEAAKTFSSQTLVIKDAASGDLHYLTLKSNLLSRTPLDFNAENNSGATFARVLAAGSYEIVDVRLVFGQLSWSVQRKFSTPFKVSAGQLNYLGQIKLGSIVGKNWIGATVPDQITFAISDERSRDLPVLKALYPSLPWDDVLFVTPRR
jgi:hypothetical protein